MKIKIFKLRMVLVVFVANSFFLVSGCSNLATHRVTWISTVDMESCKAAAVQAFSREHTQIHLDGSRAVLARVDDWRSPVITIYLPVLEILPAGLTYAYYQFNGSPRFVEKADLSHVAVRSDHTFKMGDGGIVSWGTGPLNQPRSTQDAKE